MRSRLCFFSRSGFRAKFRYGEALRDQKQKTKADTAKPPTPRSPPGITTYLENGDTIEHAQQIANHESPKTTKLYDRTSDKITLDDVERMLI